MMTDNYLNMKEMLKLLILIISSQIIYDHMEIIQYQHLFICYLFIYLFIHQSIYWIHNISPVSPCSVTACHLIKIPPVNLSPEAVS